MRATAFKKKAGFTLPEVVLSATIMAIGLSVFAATLTMSTKAVYTARNQLIGMNYARMEVEKKRNYVYGSSQLDTGTTTFSNSLYSGQIVISYVGGSSTTKLKNVTAKINWRHNAKNVYTNLQYSAVMSSCMH